MHVCPGGYPCAYCKANPPFTKPDRLTTITIQKRDLQDALRSSLEAKHQAIEDLRLAEENVKSIDRELHAIGEEERTLKIQKSLREQVRKLRAGDTVGVQFKRPDGSHFLATGVVTTHITHASDGALQASYILQSSGHCLVQSSGEPGPDLVFINSITKTI